AFAITEGRPDDWSPWVHSLKQIAVALSLFPSSETSAALLPLLSHKAFGQMVAEYFQEHPAEATRALGPKLLESSQKAARTTELLAAIARMSPGEVTAAAADLSAPARSAIAKLLDAGAGEDASVDELPRVLRDPPWRSKGPRASARVVAGLVPLPHVERIGDAAPADMPNFDRRPPRDAALAAFERTLAQVIAAGKGPGLPSVGYVSFLRLPRERALWIWNEAPLWSWDMATWHPRALLNEYGEAAMPGLLRLGEAGREAALT